MPVGASANWQTVTVGQAKIPVIAFRCRLCSKPIKKRFAEIDGHCIDCPGKVGFGHDGIAAAWSLTVYLDSHPDFPSTGVVRASKNDHGLTVEMMRAAAKEMTKNWPWNSWQPDVIVPCPSSKVRTFPRSFALGAGVSEVLQRPLADMLVRSPAVAPRSSLTGKRPASSFEDLHDQACIEAQGVLAGHNVLLVDDLLTTGVTSAASAMVLRQAGAGDIRLLTFARYTDKHNLEGYCD